MTKVHAFTGDCLGELDAVGVATAIRTGEFSAEEAALAALARIDAVEPQLNAVAFDDREHGLARAAAGDFPDGSLRGVPSMIKNNTIVDGIPTMHGSAAVPPTPATTNEKFTDQLLASGVNILGATTLPAFGLTATTEFVDRPPTRNPWNTEYSAGASSGGAAALVAAGALPIAHANDGGGSIRIPAAACGLVGLKPSRDRVLASAEGESLPIDLISNGVVSRSVRDTAHFIADTQRYAPAKGMPDLGLVEGPSGRRLRIALIAEPITGGLLDPETSVALEAVAEVLAAQGHMIDRVPLPVERSYVRQFTDYWSLLAFSLDHFGKRLIDKGFDRSKLDPFTVGLSKQFLRRFWATPGVLLGLRKSTKQFRALFDQFDVVYSPTLGHTTPKIGFLDPGGDFDEVFERLVQYVTFTPANNTSGTPAISLPLAQTKDGLPIGLHFAADVGQEQTLLELAYQLEAERPFARIQD
ncbi:putative amidase [Gordonia araii NBRC 100433]|uniref:amidase n=1 Tax=Gordonia araii NBRC 100433 TaxID=1073574 RepID=G7GXQ8_9ACTN|nr:amidase [Gordonia araii]NNG98057.1 amidase [Gordonia araii NBRC 100433]GAB08383.1 putative amidase [Gordonia araii NBRC 100433]